VIRNVCSIDSKRFADVTATFTAAMGDEPWEMIGIHDARSLAEGYNRGVARSVGEYLIFSHDDIEILSSMDFAARLKGHLNEFDLVGVAGTTRLIHPSWFFAGPPYLFGQIVNPDADGQFTVSIFGAPMPFIRDIQAIDGVFIAARRAVFSRIAFDAVNFNGFHLYDMDFSYAAYRAGMQLAVANDIHLLHASDGNFGADWQKYAALFEQKWLHNIRRPEERKMVFAGVTVRTRAEAIEVMTPSFWKQKK
jgi:GT2 family glycosyltransferase